MTKKDGVIFEDSVGESIMSGGDDHGARKPLGEAGVVRVSSSASDEGLGCGPNSPSRGWDRASSDPRKKGWLISLLLSVVYRYRTGD